MIAMGGPACLAVASLLLLVFPLIRPFADRSATSTDVAAAFASTRWVAAHVVAGAGFVLLPLGLLALYGALRETRAERRAFQGLTVGWIGIGLILPTVLGTEAFALRAVGQAAIQQNDMVLLGIVAAIRTGLQARLFFPGLLVLAAGAVLMAMAVWKSDALPRWGAVLFALGLVFFFPLFPRAVRVVDGVLIGIGGVWLAIGMLKRTNRHQEEGQTMRSIATALKITLVLAVTAALPILTAGGAPSPALAGTDNPRPTEGWTLHITAKMHFPGKPEMLAHHYCKPVAGGLIECQLYDSAAPDAHLVGVETIVNAATYAKFSPAEKAQWHYHRVEIPLVSAAVLDMSPAEAEKVVNSIVDTYGKIYLLWDPSVQPLPVGRPSVTVLRGAKAR